MGIGIRFLLLSDRCMKDYRIRSTDHPIERKVHLQNLVLSLVEHLVLLTFDISESKGKVLCSF